MIANDTGSYKLNFYLSSGETLFAGEKAQVTIDYVVTGSGLTVTHNGESFDITGGTSKTFDTLITCYSGAFDCENAVLYGTDNPHIALEFSFNGGGSITITGVSITPKTAVKTVSVTAINPKETGDDYATYITDMKEHVIDLGLNGNTLYMLPSVTGMQCLSAIITNDNGDVFVIDGGYNNDYQTIYHYVTELGKDTIKGWFFTHPHQDHFNVFSKFIAKYGAEITVEKVYYAWSEEESWYTERKSFEQNDTVWAQITAFKNAVITCGCTHIEPVTGDTYDFGSFLFEIMYSPKNGNGTYGLDLAKYGFDAEDESKGRYNVNDLSLVIKMTAGDKTLLFLGDAGVEAGKWLYDTYQGTNELEADFVQMAHHGQAGVEENVYGLIQPKYAFFNCDYAVWNNTSGKLKTLTVRGWIESLGATAYCSQLGANSVAGDSIVYIFR